MDAGDHARYLADRPHVYEALGGDARAVPLISYVQMPSSGEEMQRGSEHLLSAGDEPKRARPEDLAMTLQERIIPGRRDGATRPSGASKDP